MSAHLINISIGPVQPFIAAARRTRDLWFGSRLLSEICMETARSVKDSGGELIFPQEDSLNVSDGVDPNVANVILAELPDGDPAKVVSQAREKALSVLRGYGDQVLGFRVAQVQEETGRDLNAVKMALNGLVKRIGEPNPYLAVLKADGDKMGAAISSIKTPEGHRTFSSELASFATKAHGIVSDHGGKCIYAGGDDVLAFLPLNSCLECVRELVDAFKGSFVKSVVSDTPTLSVGIAVGHFLEPLEDLLKFADEAEAKAKGTDRNGLAVVVRSRGNAPIGFRKRWDSTVADLTVDKRLRLWARLFDEEVISSRFPYELRSMEGFYGNWKDQSSIKEAIPADVFRVLGKKRSVGGDSKEVADELKAIVEAITSVENLKELVSELLVARHLGPVMEVKS